MLDKDDRPSEEARNGNFGISEAAPLAAEPSAPAAPTNLVATVISSSQIDLTWQDNSFNEDGFIVKRRQDNDPAVAFVDLFTTGPNVTTYTDTAVQPNTTYTYRVRAFRNSGGGAASNDATVTTPRPVAAPSSLQASASEGRIDLTWQDNSFNEDGFIVKRRQDNDPGAGFVDLFTTGPNVTTYTDTAVQPNTTYTYRVRAFLNSGGGAASNEATVTTPSPVTAPSNLRATAGEGRVDLTWQDNSFNEDGFIVKRRLADPTASFTDVATVGPNTTGYTDTTIQPNTAYVYRVRAFRNAGGGAASNDAAVTTLAPVAAPTNLRALASEGKVDLVWQDNSNNEDGFKIKRKAPTDLDFLDIATVGPNVTIYTDTQIQPNTTYTYRVRAFLNTGGSAASNDASVTTLPSVAAPSNLQAIASEGQVQLSWQDNSNNEDGFIVKRRLADPAASFVDLATVGPNITTYTDTSIQPNTAYVYRVRAFRNAGGGAASNDASVTTLAPVAAPSNLRATASEGRVDLTWQDNSNNEDGFKIKRKGPNDLDLIDIGTVGPNTIFYADTTVQPNTTYVYRVRAFRNSGGGAASNDATVTTLAPVTAPSNLRATAGDGRVDLTWQDNSFNEDGFIVKRRQDNDPGAAFVDLFTTGPNVTTYTDTAVQPNTTYTYRVRAFRNSGGGAASNDATVTTPRPVAAPSSLQASASEGRIDLTWQDNSFNEDGFIVKRRQDNDPAAGFVDLFTTGPNVTMYTDTAVQPNTTYTYRVRAFRNSGGGAASNDATATTPQPLAPTVSQVISIPAPGTEGLKVGQPVTISWSSSDNVGVASHKVLFSKNGGASFDKEISPVLDGATKNYTWTPTADDVTSQGRFRVAARDAAGNRGTGDSAIFTIRSETPPLSIQVTKPSGNTTLEVGALLLIKWTGSGATHQRVQFASEGGEVTSIINGLTGDVKETTWKIPEALVLPGQRKTGRIRVIVRNINSGQEAMDDSEAILTIRGKNAPPVIFEVDPPEGPLAGGIDVTIKGMHFQRGATVSFGDTPSPEVTFDTDMALIAKLPLRMTPGVVNVTVTNPDGLSAKVADAFTYLNPKQAQRARIFKVSPSTVIEDTRIDVTLEGRNLIEAWEKGFIRFRALSRAKIDVDKAGIRTGRKDQSEVETVTFPVKVTANPKLGVFERMPIQVIASRRREAGDALLGQTSRQMFTVLPKAVPIPMGFTAKLAKGGPNLVAVAGRNLEQCTLELVHGQGETISLSPISSDDKLVVGLASVDTTADATPVRLLLRDPGGKEVGNYDIKVQEPPSLSAISALTMGESIDPGLELEPVGGQTLVAPTKTDSVVYDLRDGDVGQRTFDLSLILEFEVADVDIVIPLLNEVRMIPFFDRGGDTLTDLPINAKFGRIFRLRGVSLLLVIRLELRIQIRVVLVIRVDVGSAPFLDDGFENEFPGRFPDFPNSFGTLTVGIRIEVSASVLFALLVALVKKIDNFGNTELVPLLTIGFVAGIDFSLTNQNRTLMLEGDFGLDVGVRINAIKPGKLRDMLAGKLLLATDQGQEVFPDAFGGFRAFYFAAKARRYCVPWEFDLELTRRSRFGGGERPEPFKFTTEICFDVEPAPVRGIVIESKPQPTGDPPTLELDRFGRATITAFAVPVDEAGNPIPGRKRDELQPTGEVDFFLENDSGILDPITLPAGDGFAILEGGDNIRASVPTRGTGVLPSSVAGFRILSFLAAGQPPRVVVDPFLPVRVRAQQQTVIVKLVVNPLTRAEPFQPQPDAPMPLSLMVMTGSNATGMVPLKVKVLDITSLTHPDTGGDPLAGRFDGNANSGRQLAATATPNDRYRQFFGGTLMPQAEFDFQLQADQTGSAQTVSPITVQPNHKEVMTGTGLALVAPHDTKISLKLMVAVDRNTSMVDVKFANGTNQTEVDLTVRGVETYEEYYRVLTDVQDVYARAPTAVRQKPEQLADLLPTAADAVALGTLLDTQGQLLFTEAVSAVQRDAMDDRALYYARLQAIVLIRQHCLQKALPPPPFITRYELASRGITRLAFNANRNALVTGFDPFQLDRVPDRGNPSGLAALSLNGRTLGTGADAALVQTCVFPVRWDDFDAGMVEDAVAATLGKIDLLVTMSRTTSMRGPYYDIDRFAGKRRGAGDNRDNNNRTRPLDPMTRQPQEPRNLAIGSAPEFLETTLPYKRVVTASNMTLLGPDPVDYFVLNQRFEEFGGNQQDYSFTGTPEAFTPLEGLVPPKPKPDPQQISQIGSGGGYLSNEIFYRTALLRQNRRPTLASGHLHLPILDDTTATSGQASNLVSGVREALTRLLAATPSVVALNPSFFSLVPGGAETLTLRIDPVQPSDTVVPLTNTAPNVVDVPASVTVPAN